MSIEQSTKASNQLTPTSYLVLGLLAREGPSTPYDLKRHVAATIGHFWSFPHALLYKEPPRLVELGLATETQEQEGRRRRTFTITGTGRQALRAWLSRPARQPTELRDPGLLQLFFADMGSSGTRRDIAAEQLAIHQKRLTGNEEVARLHGGSGGSNAGHLTLEQWHDHGLRMELLYERAAVGFWEGVERDLTVEEAAAAKAQAEGVAMSSIPSPSSTPALEDDGAYLAALPNPQVCDEEVGDEARGIEGIGGAAG